MAAFESVRCRFWNRPNMRAALRQLSRRAGGGEWRGCSTATRQENELELGEPSPASAPKLISQKVGDITLHTELRLFCSIIVNTGLVLGNHSY